MTPEARALARQCILRIAGAASVNGVRPEVYQELLVLRGITCSLEQVTQELEYVKEKGLIIELAELLSPELKRYKISAAGRDHLATLGF